jgi:hypothetical protein
MNLGISLIHSMVCNTVWVRLAKPMKLTTFVQLRGKLRANRHLRFVGVGASSIWGKG